MHGLLASIIGLVGVSRYALLFVGTLFGSPLVMVAAGYLVHINQLEFFPVYLTVVSADIVGDIGWYWIGRIGARPFLMRYGYHFGVTQDIVDRLEVRFLEWHERILIISKLTMGFGVAIGVLAVAGMTRVPFWRYLGINLAGELVWALIPIAIGFYFGNISDFVPLSVRWAFVIAGFICVAFATRYALKKLAAREW